MNTQHASVRAQQRGIPLFIDQALDLYGCEQYDGHGARIVSFDKRSIRNMQRDWGKAFVDQITRWRGVYKVTNSSGERTITVGHLKKRINRK